MRGIQSSTEARQRLQIEPSSEPAHARGGIGPGVHSGSPRAIRALMDASIRYSATRAQIASLSRGVSRRAGGSGRIGLGTGR